jgi:hypothetical protein
VSATICSNLQCQGRSARTATIKPVAGLILAVLAISAAASIRVTHDPAGAGVSQPSLSTESASSGGSTFVVFPSAGMSAGTAAGIKPARPRILRITP